MANITETLKTDIAHKKDFVKKTGTGDLDSVSGLDNLRFALLRRLVTVPGTVIHRPSYGVGVQKYRDAIASMEKKREITLKIDEQFTQDSRVEKVIGVRFDADDLKPDLIKIVVRVKVVGYGEAELSFQPFIGEVA